MEVFAGGGYECSSIVCFELLRLVDVDDCIVNGKLDARRQDIVNPLIPTPNLVRPGMEFISLFLQMDLQKDKPCFTQMSIGDTLYIVEFMASETTTETAYDKIKRLISDNVNSIKTLA